MENITLIELTFDEQEVLCGAHGSHDGSVVVSTFTSSSASASASAEAKVSAAASLSTGH